MQATDVYIKSPDIVHRRVAGESVLVPIRGAVADMQRLFALDGTAEFIWECLDGDLCLNEIAALMAEKFDVDEQDSLGDLSRFIADLEEHGLVKKFE